MKRIRNECGHGAATRFTDYGSPSFNRVAGVKTEIEEIGNKQELLEKKVNKVDDKINDKVVAALEENNKTLIAQFKQLFKEEQGEIIQKKINSSLLTFREEHNKEIMQELSCLEFKIKNDLIQAMQTNNSSLLQMAKPKVLDMNAFFSQKYGSSLTESMESSDPWANQK
jgi:hypothetical protein